jgi:hypothetical protein
MELQLQVGDRAKMASGRERGQMMIRSARKHMVKVGWILSRSRKLWEITAAYNRLTSRLSWVRRGAEVPVHPRVGAMTWFRSEVELRESLPL